MNFSANRILARRVAAGLRIARLLLLLLAFAIVRRIVRRA
jgi:hypothetical protein